MFREGPSVHGKGPGGLFRKTVGWLRAAARDEFDAVVVLIDIDKYPQAAVEMSQAQDSEVFLIRRACGVAIRSFDAWFLADHVALSEVIERTVDTQPLPERNRNPKQDCHQFRNDAGLQSLSDFYRNVAERANFDTLRERCPDGFAPFADRVQALPPTD